MAIFAGLAASLVAIGLARFAYTPLIPPLIEARWFGASDVVYLGAANFAGYFAGALSGRRLGARFSNRTMLRWMMALAALSFAACAFPVSLAWYFGWRLLSGFAGAVVMVLVAQTILPTVAPARRGLASGAIFMGIGAGIVASGTLVPLLLGLGLAATWLGLAAVSALLAVLTWRAWPAHVAVAPPAGGERMPAAVRLLYAAYAAVAVGLLGAAVFLVDYVARGLGRGTAAGAVYWIVYGVGALSGPLLYGLLADRIGFGRALRAGLVLSGAAALSLAYAAHPAALAVASALLGAFTPGVVTLMIGRLHELLPGDGHAQHAAWGHSTTMFALFQALAGYAFSFLFAHSGGRHHVVFVASALAFGAALLLEGASARRR
ncbi:YbfB/YjiJ family MFS transporter [Pseudoduganella umbonata]|uniref:Putative MFS family arabinose efflux permease n=1 Tax=Pseudoduganella umbonata TaxID=864828 RepID=A0A7W5E6B7_9BURK|nr:YbfB/YjiJ family MFS transporter [Pseudoduganella umbonata]MBB3219484.1 putative MFS family arabinose efflux permease [Pseudoduganella umbonata]